MAEEKGCGDPICQKDFNTHNNVLGSILQEYKSMIYSASSTKTLELSIVKVRHWVDFS